MVTKDNSPFYGGESKSDTTVATLIIQSKFYSNKNEPHTSVAPPVIQSKREPFFTIWPAEPPLM